MNNPPVRTFILPSSFDPFELLPRSLHKFSDDARYIGSLILRKTAKGQSDERGYVPLKAEYLRAVISERRGRDVIQSLLDAEAIHRTPYIVGVRSFAYRLDDRYQADPHIRLPIENKRLLRKLELHSARCQQEAESRMKPVHFTLASLQHDLQIDALESKAILTTLPVQSNPYDVQGVLIQDILDRRFRLSVGDYGRVANCITSMKRELRTALRCSGMQLAGVDIACAQPSLLSLCIRLRQKMSHHRLIPRWLPLLPAALSCPSLVCFADACFSGELYSVLGTQLRNAGCDWNRDTVKKRFLTDVIAKRGEYPSAMTDVFKAQFHGVWRFIKDVNQDDHATLIRILQQLEAWLVIEQVCGKFVTRHPGSFVISLHDACYCQHSMLGALVDCFEDVFRELDFKPTLKVEGTQ